MKAHAKIFESFARLLRYPIEGRDATLDIINQCHALLAEHEDAQQELLRLRKRVEEVSDHALEELYAQTFDINPAITLDVGFHLFGLAYKRGDFLVRMQQALREYNIEQGSELADHLPLLLELSARLSDADGNTFVGECLSLPVHRMSEGFAREHHGYGNLLKALNSYLSSHFESINYQYGESHEQPIAGSTSLGA